MAFAGLKKQFNKANQYMTEKIGGAEGTKLDDEFMEMEKKADVTYELVEELQLKTKEYLQPNPTARAKMAAVKGISKLSGQAKASTYPQPEGVLGECMTTYGRKLGEDSVFALSLIEVGESLKQMADNKYSLDDNVKQMFLEPLHHLQTKDLKEVMHHRKKLQGRRLDFDCKKRKQVKALGKSPQGSPFSSPIHHGAGRSPRGVGSHITDDELKLAEDKFAESLHLAQMGMHNLLENDVEQVTQLASFIECLLEYHRTCTDILQNLTEIMKEKIEEAASRPKREFKPKSVHDLQLNLESHISADGHSDHSKDAMNGDRPPPYSLHNIHASNNFSRPFQGRTPQRSPLSSPLPSNRDQEWEAAFDPHADASPVPSPMKSSPARTPSVQGPCCKALYDFEPENEGELGFKEGDTIQLLSRIDENWYEGSVNGVTGYFPVNYVNVVVPLPQ